jgi:hypothetical protein
MDFKVICPRADNHPILIPNNPQDISSLAKVDPANISSTQRWIGESNGKTKRAFTSASYPPLIYSAG